MGSDLGNAAVRRRLANKTFRRIASCRSHQPSTTDGLLDGIDPSPRTPISSIACYPRAVRYAPATMLQPRTLPINGRQLVSPPPIHSIGVVAQQLASI